MFDTDNTPAVPDDAAKAIAQANLLEEILYDEWDRARHESDHDRTAAVWDLYDLAKTYRTRLDKAAREARRHADLAARRAKYGY